MLSNTWLLLTQILFLLQQYKETVKPIEGTFTCDCKYFGEQEKKLHVLGIEIKSRFDAQCELLEDM